jgi:glucokinase
VSAVIGVDLGGTKVAAALLRDGELCDSVVHPTELSSSDALLHQLVEMVSDVRVAGKLREHEVDAVGIGVPSVVEFATGRVVSSVNIPLTDLHLRSVLGRRLGVPVFVDNDATVAALAEAHNEEFRLVTRNLVMLTLGTGLGGGLVLGGRTYRGATGGAGEIGHTLVALDLHDGVPAPDGFPQPGSIESLAAGRALDRLATRAGLASGVAAVDAAQAGDAVAGAIIERWARVVGIAIANAINVFDPDEVVLGGGAARAGELLLAPARDVAWGFVLPGVGRLTTVRIARHGVRAGVLGAALLAAQELGGAGVWPAMM